MRTARRETASIHRRPTHRACRQLGQLSRYVEANDLSDIQTDLGDVFSNKFLIVYHESDRTMADELMPFWQMFAHCACYSGPWVDDTVHVRPHTLTQNADFFLVGGNGRIAAVSANGMMYAGLRQCAMNGSTYMLFHSGGQVRKVACGENWAQVNLGRPKEMKASLPHYPHLRKAPMLVDTGEPHAVSFEEDLADLSFDFRRLGKIIERSFGPSGINWSLVAVFPDRLWMRTFERGVSRPTTSCGTGSAAAFWLARKTGRISESTFTVSSVGGDHTLADDGGELLISGRPKHHISMPLGELLDRWGSL